jgi:hypothetical protein
MEIISLDEENYKLTGADRHPLNKTMKGAMSLSISEAHNKKSGLDGADIGPEV